MFEKQPLSDAQRVGEHALEAGGRRATVWAAPRSIHSPMLARMRLATFGYVGYLGRRNECATIALPWRPFADIF